MYSPVSRDTTFATAPKKLSFVEDFMLGGMAAGISKTVVRTPPQCTRLCPRAVLFR